MVIFHSGYLQVFVLAKGLRLNKTDLILGQLIIKKINSLKYIKKINVNVNIDFKNDVLPTIDYFLE